MRGVVVPPGQPGSDSSTARSCTVRCPGHDGRAVVLMLFGWHLFRKRDARARASAAVAPAARAAASSTRQVA